MQRVTANLLMQLSKHTRLINGLHKNAEHIWFLTPFVHQELLLF